MKVPDEREDLEDFLELTILEINKGYTLEDYHREKILFSRHHVFSKLGEPI
jgi:hypothetical protein